MNDFRVGLCVAFSVVACGQQPEIPWPDDEEQSGGSSNVAGSGADAGSASSTGGSDGGSGGTTPTGGSSSGGVPAGGATTGGFAGSASPQGGASTGGVGGSTEQRCDFIASCRTEPGACSAGLGATCNRCSIGSYACGSRQGFYTSDGADYPCAGQDCLGASSAASAHCCGSTGGSGGAGNTGGVGGAGGSGGSGSRERCPEIQDCISPYSCAPLSMGCSICDYDEYTCDLGAGVDSYKIYRATDGQSWLCINDNCTPESNSAFMHCCP